MSGAFRITRRAQADLDEIWLYVAADRPEAADQLLDRFQARFELLASQPHLGESRPEIGPRLRSFPVGSYIVYYRLLEEDAGVEIVRLLHGARGSGAATIF
jgi:toxin ParE1/3/4